ncbi:LysR family transcriptional regulator [Azohydromonas australica]|uniref:LysR family transcriptional regulator n=1 Tax=Azohydromonas australica TaxID=364039 RepID=UPI000428C4AE|nr:LysR family transcriptional regulator [Azohydromonas australica]
MNLQTFDLNLLRVFAAIHAEGNVSRAAMVVGLSQPAMSNALLRLRRACDDPLFVRTADGMAPTALADAMIGPVREALAHLKQALEQRTEFDPRHLERTFRVLTSDVGAAALLPPLMQVLETEAPHVVLEAVQLPHEQYARTLQEGRADLAIGHLPFLTAGFHQQRLFHDSYCCIASAQHPQLRGEIKLAQFVAARHVAIASGNADAQVDRELARRRRRRSVALRVAEYHTAVEVVAATSLIATVPRRAMQAARGLQTMPLPFTLPQAHVRQFWHSRVDQDAANRWLRARLMALEFGAADA